MVLYTPIPLQEIFQEQSEEKKKSNVQLPFARGTIEVELTSDSTAKIVRLVSSDINDYLHPELQPGKEIKLTWDLIK
ncbi:MAG: hypothetical protein GXZ07_06655 [Firmicutes bacterium]|nr:hypothetical protein [Bacillota bacterium]